MFALLLRCHLHENPSSIPHDVSTRKKSNQFVPLDYSLNIIENTPNKNNSAVSLVKGLADVFEPSCRFHFSFHLSLDCQFHSFRQTLYKFDLSEAGFVLGLILD